MKSIESFPVLSGTEVNQEMSVLYRIIDMDLTSSSNAATFNVLIPNDTQLLITICHHKESILFQTPTYNNAAKNEMTR